jgi:arginine/lysine/ornithine decarboxylase
MPPLWPGQVQSYFVLNGTSASNKIVLSSLVAEDDLVLFDRNNHKAAGPSWVRRSPRSSTELSRSSRKIASPKCSTKMRLNGTSASNKIVLSSLVAEDDLVLFDRNNHKAAHHAR